jgi:hypothetical protein
MIIITVEDVTWNVINAKVDHVKKLNVKVTKYIVKIVRFIVKDTSVKTVDLTTAKSHVTENK